MQNEFLRSVERFVSVADAGSIQGAAKVLHISQPALTHSIAKIEDGFGTRLFDRNKRGIALTRAGEILYAHAKTIVAEGEMAVREINDLIAGHLGRLFIRAGSSWGYSFMPEIIANLKLKFPELDLQFDIGNTTEAYPQLARGEIDAIIGKYEPDAVEMSGIEFTELATFPYVLICNSTHKLASKKTVTRSDLSGVPFVAYKPDIEIMNSILEPLCSDGEPGLEIAICTRSPHAVLEMAIAGNFLACLSKPFVQKFKNRDLKILPTDFRTLNIQTGVYYRQTLTQTDPFKELLRHLQCAVRGYDLDDKR